MEVIGGLWVPWKFSGLPDYAHGYFPQNFVWAFVPIDPMNVRKKFEVRSFAHSWDDRGYPKIGAVHGYTHALFPVNFNGILFGLALWMYLPNLKSVALPVPKIIGAAKKFRAVPGYAHASYPPPQKKIL